MNMIIKLWAFGSSQPWATLGYNSEGRFIYNLAAVPPEIQLSHFSIEPDKEDSKVAMTHYGAKYSP